LQLKKKLNILKKEYEKKLLELPNVVGLGIGFKETKNIYSKKLCLKVYVEKKLPLSLLLKNQIVPKKIKGIETDVEEIGKVKTQ